MGPVQIVATVLTAGVTIVAVALAVRAVLRIVAVVRLGQPDPDRFTKPLGRTGTMLVEIVGHTRMLKWSLVGAAHWFVMVAFITLSLLVLEAYFDVVDPTAELPLLGGWLPYGLLTELIGALGLLGIGVLIVIRLLNRPTRPGGRSRLSGSTMWQGYFVEYVIVAVLACGFIIRGLKVAGDHFAYPGWATPISHGLGAVLPADEAAISWVALAKIAIS